MMEEMTISWVLVGILGSAVIGLVVWLFNQQQKSITELYKRDNDNTKIIIRLQENHEQLTEIVKELKEITHKHELTLARYDNPRTI